MILREFGNKVSATEVELVLERFDDLPNLYAMLSRVCPRVDPMKYQPFHLIFRRCTAELLGCKCSKLSVGRVCQVTDAQGSSKVAGMGGSFEGCRRSRLKGSSARRDSES